MIDPIFLMTVQYFLAAFLFLSGLHKVLNVETFKEAIIAYQLVPEKCIRTVASVLIFSELLAGVMLFVSPTIKWAVLIAILIFGAYFFAILINLQRGRTNIDCGCSFFNREAPLSFWHLVRNGLLVVMVLLMLLPSNGRELIFLDMAQVGVAALCLGFLYLGFESLLANRIYTLDEEI